jgi:hypothetical protein
MITGPEYWMPRIADDDGNDPGPPWAPDMFETVDSRISPAWTVTLEGGHLRPAPALEQRHGFWNDYFDNNPEALADFERGKMQVLDAEDPGSGACRTLIHQL